MQEGERRLLCMPAKLH